MLQKMVLQPDLNRPPLRQALARRLLDTLAEMAIQWFSTLCLSFISRLTVL
jgi:hypothetical protein